MEEDNNVSQLLDDWACEVCPHDTGKEVSFIMELILQFVCTPEASATTATPTTIYQQRH